MIEKHIKQFNDLLDEKLVRRYSEDYEIATDEKIEDLAENLALTDLKQLQLLNQDDLQGFNEEEADLVNVWFYATSTDFEFMLPTGKKIKKIIKVKDITEFSKDEFLRMKQIAEKLKQRRDEISKKVKEEYEKIKQEKEERRREEERKELLVKTQKLKEENEKLKRIIRKLISEEEIEKIEEEIREREEAWTKEDIELIKEIL
jgi:hypothetical protein